MNDVLIPAAALVIIEDEPRILDTDLAERLGFKRHYDIRETIARNLVELETYGALPVRHGQSRGQKFKAYYLNEGQALVICALSRTAKAAQVRKALIDVFMAYRAGKLVHVKEHRRRLPVRHEPDTFDSNMAFVNAFANDSAAMLELFAGTMTRLDRLERQAGLDRLR